MLTIMPDRPSDQRAGGRVSGQHMRRQRTQPIDKVYESMIATVLSETMALKAVELPILIRESRTEMKQDMAMALAGIWSLG